MHAYVYICVYVCDIHMWCLLCIYKYTTQCVFTHIHIYTYMYIKWKHAPLLQQYLMLWFFYFYFFFFFFTTKLLQGLCAERTKHFKSPWNFPGTDLDHVDQTGYEDQSCSSGRNTGRMNYRFLSSVSSHRSKRKTMI